MNNIGTLDYLIESKKDVDDSLEINNIFKTATLIFAALSSTLNVSNIFQNNSKEEKNVIEHEMVDTILDDQETIETFDISAKSKKNDFFVSESIEEAYKKIKLSIPVDEEINVESKNFLKNILDFEKEERIDEYYSILFLAFAKKDTNAFKSILIYLSSLKYTDINDFEEDFITFGLRYGDLETQEIALNALLSIGCISKEKKDILKSVRIKNSYLQNDLLTFIEENI